MKLLPLLIGAALATAVLLAPAPAADAAPAVAPSATPAAAALPQPVTPDAELKALVAKVRAKMQAGEVTAATLAPELAEFDTLLAKYAGKKTDEVAMILMMKATLYTQVLDDEPAGVKLLEQVKADFPGTRAATAAERSIAAIEDAAKAKAAQDALIGKPAPALNFTWSTREGLKTLADLKGKVVVLDFWATWCGPCIRSFPQVRDLVTHYQGADVEVVGVTSIQGTVSGLDGGKIDTSGDPAKEITLLGQFAKAKDMTWIVAVSEENVFNPAYGITGIPHLVIVAPDGTVRHTGMHPADPAEEKHAKIDALLKEFKLKGAK